jgi:cytochrome c peroxidase
MDFSTVQISIRRQNQQERRILNADNKSAGYSAPKKMETAGSPAKSTDDMVVMERNEGEALKEENKRFEARL